MIESAKNYVNEIPTQWKKNAISSFAHGCFWGALQQNRVFLKGTAAATGSLINSTITPLLKKIENKNIQQIISCFTKHFITLSITSANPLTGLTGSSLVTILYIFSTRLDPDSTFINKADCYAMSYDLYFAAMHTNNSILGLQVGALALTARVVCNIVYPFIQQKITQYEIFKKTGIDAIIQDLPEGWGLACSKRAISIYSTCRLISSSVTALFLTTVIPLGATYFHAGFKTILNDNEEIELLVNFSSKTVEDTRDFLGNTVIPSLETFILRS